MMAMLYLYLGCVRAKKTISGLSASKTFQMKRLSAINVSLENNFPTFRLKAPVVIVLHNDDWSIQLKRPQVIFQAQVGNR